MYINIIESTMYSKNVSYQMINRLDLIKITNKSAINLSIPFTKASFKCLYNYSKIKRFLCVKNRLFYKIIVDDRDNSALVTGFGS